MVNDHIDTHDVISAFLDDERFEANALVEALSQPEGRAILIDLIALRHLTRAEHGSVPALSLSLIHI